MAEFHAGRNTVTFKSGEAMLTGNLYLPADFDLSRRYPGVIVGGTWTSVKEQMSDRYASRLAEQGYAALDYDFRNYGESEGEPRQFESPALKIEDNRSAIDYLLTLPFIDADRIGALGICASAGYMAGTIVVDPRVKSFGVVAPWLHNAELVKTVYGGEEGVQAKLEAARTSQQKYEATGEVDYVPACDPNDPNAAMPLPLDFYTNPQRGAIPEWTNRFAVMAWQGWLEFDGVGYGANITVPTAVIHSEKAALPDGAKQFYRSLTGTKTSRWIDGEQIDFYDQEPQVSESVAFVVDHFNQTL
jgi:dienelactone hydrolase